MGILEIAIVIIGLVCLGSIIFGSIMLLIQLGVIAKKATESTYQDTSDYTIDQGRDVGNNDPPPQ